MNPNSCCPSGKRQYHDGREAERALRKIRKRRSEYVGHIYSCGQCFCLHIGSKSCKRRRLYRPGRHADLYAVVGGWVREAHRGSIIAARWRADVRRIME